MVLPGNEDDMRMVEKIVRLMINGIGVILSQKAWEAPRL